MMRGVVLKAALIGAAQGAILSAIIFLTSSKRNIADDWLLLVMVVVANASAFAVAARFQISMLGVAVAGLIGLFAGGWVGNQLIGYYEYTVPVAQEDRAAKIIVKGEVVRELQIGPAEKTKRIPVGAAVGGLLGFALTASIYGAIAWRQRESEFDEPPAAPQL
jgi:hypothetical protein